MNIIGLLGKITLINGLPVLAFNMKGVVMATVLVSVTGLIIGILLGIAAKKFEIKVDEKVALVRDLLPGNNCGACGYAGCDAMAEAVAAGKAPVNGCPVANSAVHAQIAEVMGTEAGEVDRQVAFVKCAGTCDKAKAKYNYVGIKDCKQANVVPGGGPKQCTYGCTGYGSCVDVCEFDAIHIVDGIALVDKEKCTSCGLCIKECPKNLIELVPYKAETKVRCNSKDKGPVVKQGCSIGCIGCKLCEKACQYDAIHVDNNLALIDYSKCTNCGECVKKCPTKVILSELAKNPNQAKAV